MTQQQNNMTAQALSKAVVIALMIIPTAISIFVAIEVKSMTSLAHEAVSGEPQIVCFDPDVCAIEVHSKWYRISGVIKMDETIPEEYQLHDLIDEAEMTRVEIQEKETDE